jgi:uncharacterized small protein (TIGR04563 family)
MPEQRKQSLYFPREMLEEIRNEAARLDRSLSWIVQRAWKVARELAPNAAPPGKQAESSVDLTPGRQG